VVGVEEELAVKAERGEPGLQEGEHQLVRVRLGGHAHFAEQRLVHAHLIVLDVGAVHLDRAFIFLVGDGVAVGGHGLHDARADPFNKPGELAQPAVGVALAAGRNQRGHVGPAGRGLAEHALVFGLVGGEQRRNERGGDDCHITWPPWLS
jgi:hypothetical protein